MNIIRAAAARKQSADTIRIARNDILDDSRSTWLLDRIDKAIKKDSKDGKFQSVLYMIDHDGRPSVSGKILDAVLHRLVDLGYQPEVLDGSLYILWNQPELKLDDTKFKEGTAKCKFHAGAKVDTYMAGNHYRGEAQSSREED